MRKQQIIGRVYAKGDAKVTGLKGRDQHGHQLVEFECRRISSETGRSCGKRHVCRLSALKSGRQTSCGCGKRERTSKMIDRLASRIFDAMGMDGHRAIAVSSNQLGYRGAARKHRLGKLGPYVASSITASVRCHDRAVNNEFLDRYGYLESRLAEVIQSTAKASAFGERPYRAAAGTFTPGELSLKRDGIFAGKYGLLYWKVQMAEEALKEIPKPDHRVANIAALIREFRSIVYATMEHRARLRKHHEANPKTISAPDHGRRLGQRSSVPKTGVQTRGPGRQRYSVKAPTSLLPVSVGPSEEQDCG